MMRVPFRLLPLLAAVLFLFSSCHRTPKYIRYIPKDAFMVLGIHTGEMRKELAWSAITGSNLLDELRKTGSGDKAPQALKDIEASGLDFGSTLYFYAKPDTRFANSMKLAAVLPVKDKAQLDKYIQSHFAGLAISVQKGRSEAFIDRKFMLSWNDDVLMAMSPVVNKVAHNEAVHTDIIDSAGGGEPYTWTEEVADPAATSVEMAAAFQPVKASGIDELSRFKELEGANHDLTFWMSYDAMMDMYNSYGGGDIPGVGMMGMTMGNTLFKGSAMASGYDFEKGRIDGIMRYYASDSMKPVAKEFGRENVDGDMLRRLPAPGLNMAGGFHLSPAAIKLMLEKMNLSGMANLALMSQGITMDEVLGGFTGDMVFAINNFRITRKVQVGDSAAGTEYGMVPYPVTMPEMDFVYALEIGDRTKLIKLFGLFGKSEMLQQTSANTYVMMGGKSSLVIGDKYIALSSNAATAQAFLKEHAGAMPDAVHKEIAGHPVGMWADVAGLINAGGALASSSPSDSAAFSVVKNAFTTFSMKGGAFKDGANEYQMSLGFRDNGESSLLQLLHIAQQLSALRGKKDEFAAK